MEKVQLVIDSTVKNSQSMITAQKRLRRLSKEFDSFNGVMSLSLPHFQAFSNAGVQMQTRMGRTAMAVRQATHGMRGFRMELLGVMFFGSMVMGFFTGLLRPAMETYGVFELWTDMLTVLFLPIMQKIYPYMQDFMLWVMDLPEPVKLAIGALALLGVAIGGLLFIVSSLGLGIGSLILMFSDLTFAQSMKAAGSFGKSLVKLSAKLLKLGGTKIMSTLGTLSTGLSALASTALGAALIIGAAFLAAFAISSWGLKEQGKEYKSVWHGIAGTVVDAVLGIGVIIAALVGVVVSVLEIIWKNFKNTFKMIAAGFMAAIRGEDISDALSAAYESVDFKGIFEKNMVTAGVIATTSTGIKDKLGLVKDIPGANIAPSGTTFTPNTPWSAPTNQSVIPTEVNVTNNISVADKFELEKIMDENQRKMMDEIRRFSTVS